MCNCPSGVTAGTYENQVVIEPIPPHMADYKKQVGGNPLNISVDACLRDEVMQLWSIGITTTGCCCGHNKLPPYIGVIYEDIPRMKAMGYEVQPHPLHKDREDSFKPKTII